MRNMYYLAPYCFGLEDSLANAFEAQGLNVRRRIYAHHNREKEGWLHAAYNYYGSIRRIKKLFDQFGFLNSFLGKQLSVLNETILKEAADHKPEFIFIVKGEILFPDTLKKLRAIAPLISYHWDDPFLRYAQKEDATGDIRFQNIRESYGLYDLTFVYDESYIEPLIAAGARRAVYLMDWYEPEIYKPLALSQNEQTQWGGEVAFVGAPYPNRLELLQALAPLNVSIWGPQFRWQEYFGRYPYLRKAYRGEAQGQDAVKIYNASKISLNIHDTFQCNTSVNNRTFQILASGGFELVDDRERLYRLFDVGRDLATYHSTDEAAQRVTYFLAHPEEREAIRHRGQQKSALHSATHRAQFILEELQTLKLEKSGARI
jgi:spore maturation protein CgeB